MSGTPRLQVSDLPGATNEEASATASPARGREMRQSLLQKLRPPPFTHSWDFWHDRQNRTNASMVAKKTDSSESSYEDHLMHLSTISDVKAFWSTFNNFDVSALPQQDSVHLFHKGVKPVWEDPRNIRGGCWTFRIVKEKASSFWTEICMLAIGEKLQEAVATNRAEFNDDICGVSLSVRFTSCLVQVWNRDAEHSQGINKLLAVVMEAVPEELRPKDTACYYKKHSEHAGFNSTSAKRDNQHSNQDPGIASTRTNIKQIDPRAAPIPHSPLGNQMLAPPPKTPQQNAEEADKPPGPKMPPKTEPTNMYLGDKSRSMDVQQGMAPPGISHQVTKGSSNNRDAETLQDMEDAIGAMKAAMDIVAERNGDAQ